MKIEIKSCRDGEIIWTVEAENFGKALALAVKNGIDLSNADLGGADLSYAALSYAVFQDANLSNADLSNADLNGADLSNADLNGADLSNANLSRAILYAANLCAAKMIGAKLCGTALGGGQEGNFNPYVSLGIHPDIELPRRVAEAVLSDSRKLNMRQWHAENPSCGTTHCLAGWAVYLSGAAGAALEKFTSTSVAGAILMPSAAHLFYEDDKAALVWCKKQLVCPLVN